MKRTWISFAVMALMGASGVANASVHQPQGLNLGGTSFMDGFGSNDPGWAYIQLFRVNRINKTTDSNGDSNPLLKDPRIGSELSLHQILYNTDVTIGGGRLGFTAILPLVRVGAKTAADSPVQLHSSSGIGTGDLTLGAYLQMRPVIQDGRPVFSQRFEVDILAPTGQYDAKYSANRGTNYWSVNPSWAMTWLPTKELELSTRLHYLYNSKNTKPDGVAPFITSYQSGQAVWANFAASYAINQQWRAGVSGYYFKQLSNDKANGATVADSKTVGFAMGPGLFWRMDQHNIFMANFYVPVVNKNNLSGKTLNIRWVHPF